MKAIVRLASVLCFFLMGVGNAWGVTFTKVTDVSALSSGDEIIIVSEYANKALSTTQNGNNRGAVAVTISESEITDPTDAEVITLGKSNSNWTFYAPTPGGTAGYLYAASSSKNYLRTQASNNAEGEWTISISNGDATITAQGDNTHNLMQYNTGSTIFSSYGGTQTNGAIQIYKKGASTFTATLAVNTAGYGTVSPTSVGSLSSGAAITKGTGANVNKITIGGTEVTATPHAQDADYNYAFSSWTVPGNVTTVTADITITANFTRTERALTNYRTVCCTEWSDPTLSYNTYSLNAGGAHATKTITGTTHGTLSFESSNTGVITVNSSTGEVTPVGAGTAHVIAHWTEADGYCAKDLNSSDFTVSGNVNITFKKNGGGGTDNQTQSVPVSTSTALKTLAQLGYTAPSCKRFKGWATSEANANAGTVAYATDGMNITVTEATTLWASWEDITYTISDGTMTGVGSHSYSANPIVCGATLTITCAADATHKGNPTVTATGTHGAITVVSATSVTIANVQSDMTVTISYAAKENVTVTLNPGNGTLAATGSWSKSGDNLTQTVLEGNNLTALPAATPSCSGWVFVGWATAAANNAVSDPTSKHAGDVFAPASTATYYAVYRQNSTGGTTYNKITNIGDLTTGTYVIKTSGFAMKTSDIVWNSSGGYYRMAEQSTSGSGDNITNSDATLDWTIIKFGSNYAIKSGNKYVGIDKDGILVYDENLHFFTAAYNSSNSRWEFTSAEDPTSQLVYNTYFRSMDTQSTAILLYKQGTSGTGNYFTNPVCSDYTVTGVANPAAGGSVTLSATSGKTGDKVYAYYTEDPAYRFNNWSVTGTGATLSSTSAQLTELTIGTANVTLTANFAEKVMYSVSWVVNNAPYSTGTPSSSVENGSKWSTLTLPTNPADNTLNACERTKFVGWSTSQLTGDGNSAPSDLFKSASDANADSHTITGNTTFYAVFAKGGEEGSWAVGGSDLNQTDPSAASAYDKYKGNHTKSGITFYTTRVKPNSDDLQFEANNGTLYNETAMPADITSIVLSVNTLRVYQNSSVTSAPGALTPITPTGTGPYTYTFTSGNRYFLIKEPDSGASYSTVTVNYEGTGTDYVTSCACSWQINYITNGKKDGDGAATWSEDNCFEQVGSTHEWQIADFTIPDVAGQFWVGPGSYSGHSAIEDLSSIKYVLRNDKSRTSYSAVSNMVGTLNIWDNSSDNNYYPGIYPDYQITYGVDGGSDPWTKVDFNYISGTTYETDVVTAPTYFNVANFKYYVGVKTTGNTGYGGKSNTVMMNSMSGMTANRDGKNGKWRMYENSGSNNWYCAWIPYYILSYDANGGTGAPSAETAVSSEETPANRTKTVSTTVPTRDGYTFIGWATTTAHATAGTVDYTAGNNIVLTEDVTLYAVWAQNFTVTYDLNGGTADPICSGGTYYVGQSVTVCSTTPTKTSSSFLGWKRLDTDATVSGGSTFTMPSNNVTIQAQWETVYFHIYYKEEDGTAIATDDVPQTAETTLRNQTPCAGYTFFGWSESKITTETTSKPSIIGKGGASYTPEADITVYPVYARSEGATTVKDTLTVAINNKAAYNVFSGVSKDTEGVKIHSNAVYAGSTGNSNSSIQVRATDGVVTTSSGGILKHVHLEVYSSTAKTRNIYVYGKNTAYSTFAAGAFPTGDAQGTKIATAARNVDSQTSNQMFELPAADEEFADSYQYFAFNADGAAYLVNVIVTWGTGTYYYATHCETKENVTVTYNGNSGTVGCGSPADGAITSVTWDYKNSGADAPTLASAQTICASATRSGGYILRDWTTSADGTGTHYTPGASITSLANDITLYAQWDRVYTVTFNDQGVTTPVTQATYGGTVAVPGATTPCIKDGVTWTFAGWGTVSPLSQSLAGHIIIPSGTSTYTPTEDVTLYAVYSKALGTSDAFAVGTSGAYKISVHQAGNTCYATTKNAGGTAYYCSTTVGDAGTFYLTYVNSGVNAGKYTLQNSAGEYIGHTASSASLTHSTTTPEYYNVVSANGGFRLQFANETDRYFSHGSLSDDYNYSAKKETNECYFTPAAASYYYTTMSCDDDFNITFHENGGTITWNMPLHGEGTYQHLADGTEIDVFPTATFDGWTFIGWRAADYDESTTAPEASTIYGGSDGESGNHFTIHSNTDMYPVFTRFEDNEPFDQINGGDYYIYFLESGSNDGYGNEKRVYAGTYADKKRYNSSALCSAATTFTFTKLENGNWTIYDNTTHMYLYGIENDDLKQQASATGAEWTLTVNGNQFDAFHVGTSYGQLIAQGNGTNATFMNYRRTNTAQAGYNRVYLGNCTNRTFTTNPSTTPEIDLKGTATITASQNGAVRATNVLTVSGHNLTPSTGEISITSDNSDVYFSTSTTASFALATANQPKSSITVSANSSGIVVPTPVYVHYKPSSNTDAVTDVTITASYTGAEDAEVTAEVRSVKENFVIASKIGGNWYALPANMSAEGVHEPVLIEVDESAKIAYGPATAGYKMWPVQTVNGGTDRYAANGDKVRFAGNSNAGLWASNSNNHIRDWAAITAIGSTAETPVAYEWIIETEDREAYTLKSAYNTNYLDLYRPSSGANAGKLVWATNGTYETNEVHFFPLEEREVITIFPREWKATGLVYSVAADNRISAVSYKIGTGSETATTYTRHSTGGYGLYEVVLPDLTSQYGKLLTLKMTIDGVATYATTTIPIIVNADKSTKDSEPFVTLSAETKDYDVVVLDGKTLTTDASASGACKFQNLYIYPGATLVNSANGNLSVRYLELRGGIKGIDHKSDLAQGVPHLMLGKNFSSTAGANLDMVVNTAHSYALSVPFDVSLADVNFANFLNPSTNEAVAGALDAQFLIMEYDGEQRATTGGTGWKHITSTSRTLHAGEGYVLQAKRPKGQPFGVIRFPFSSVSGWADGSGEVTKSAISISAHEGGAKTPDNDKGWNLIANPYMANVSYVDQDESSFVAKFTVGQLIKTDTNPWDGKYQYTDKTNAYVTMPNDAFSEFPQYRANTVTFEPFKNFFIQASADGNVTFERSYRAAMPRYLMAESEKAEPVYADINLTHDAKTAQAGITIDANAAEGYKFGEDQNIFESREALTYLKMYTIADGHYLVGNTLTPTEAEQLIPLEFYAPDKNGEYVFSLSETSDIEQLEYVMLYDAEGSNTDLLHDTYTIVPDKEGLIENRFMIGIRAKKKEDTATGIEPTGGGDNDRPVKFLYRDKMYILRNGVIYDATGKKVREINK